MRKTGPVLLVLCALAASVLSGCSPEDATPTDDEVASAPEASLPTAPAPPKPVELPPVPAIDEAEGAISDAKLTRCDTAEGETTAAGTETTDYLVLLSWIGEGSTVLARTSVVVAGLAAGESRDWESETVQVPSGVVACVPLVQRGSVQ